MTLHIRMCIGSEDKMFKKLLSQRNFYRNQCRVLKTQLSDAEEILKKYNAIPWCDYAVPSIDWPRLALLELLRVLKAGKALIESCHNEPCFKAYLRHSERALAFAETLKEIIWCTSVWFYTLGRNTRVPVALSEFPLPELGAYKELYMMREAASDDERELLKAVHVWIEKHRCSAKECGGPQQQADDPCIATQISERLKCAANIERSSDVDHTSVLWNINSKILEDGMLIGSGGYCSVIETAWLGDTYAKKNFPMDNPAVFKNEANALSKLGHPHMVTASAYSMGSQVYSLLMERMPHDLRQYMRKRQEEDGINPSFSILAAIDLMLQGAEAMKYMHSEGMVHRDLKPGNILVKPVDESDPQLCKEGFVIAKLADFGLAKLKNEVTNYSHLTKDQGTRLYMAPEVFRADADNDERLLVAYPKKADVYSFGIVCSEVLTGKVAFQNVKMSELYKLLTDSDKPLRPDLSESCPISLAALIRECWDNDPRKRPTFVEICTRLRYLKGLLMMTGGSRLENLDWIERTFLSVVDIQVKRELCTEQVSNTDYDPRCLVYTTFDGSSWTPAIPISLSHPMASPNGMSLAVYNGTLVGVHRVVDEWEYSRNLCWSTYTNSGWTPPQVIKYNDITFNFRGANPKTVKTIKSQTSISRPALTIFQDRLYCLYRDEDDQVLCTSAGSYLNEVWSDPGICTAEKSTDGPALAAFGDRLISVTRGLWSNVVYWNYFNGNEWSETFIMDVETHASPALAVYKNELYCCLTVVCRYQLDEGLYWSRFLGRTKWSPFIKIDCQLAFFSGPSLATFNNLLVCTVEGPDHKLYYTTFDGSDWSEVKKVPSQSSCIGDQGLCAFDSKLFCVYGAWPQVDT